MRNLFVLLLRYHAFILFIFLEVIALSLVFSKNTFQRAALLSLTQETVGAAENAFFEVNKFFTLGKVNDSLSNELAKLKEEKLQTVSTTLKHETRVKSINPSDYQLIPGKVISNTTHRRNNFITLDIGSVDGVEKNMAVISSNGIVGIIKGVSSNFSSGISVLHSDFAVGARIKGLNENGTLIWDGSDRAYAILNDIPGHVEIKKGQEIEINSYSYIFPEAIPIGVIDDFQKVTGNAFYRIKVKLNNDLRNINHVYVVKSRWIKEKVELEESVKD